MLYIITEDSNSARAFWDAVAKTFRGKNKYKMMPFLIGKDGKPSSGNSTLADQLNALLPNITSTDKIIIVFDNITKIGNIDIVDFLTFISNMSQKYNVNIAVTSYYCFEEVYLSYAELERLNADNKEVILKFVRNCLLNGIDYYNSKYIEVKDFINFYKRDSGKNREHFANALLIASTHNINGDFKIIKSGNAFEKQGRCWIKDCEDIMNDIKLNFGDKAVENKCKNKCNFKCKNCNTLDKLLDLNTNSMIANSSYDLTQI